MRICKDIGAIRAAVAGFRQAGRQVAFVPTMGFLHAGHMALVARAKAVGGAVVVSIFVNPTQFGDPADLENYPRDTDRDLQMLREAGVDAVFLPGVGYMYPPGDETIVETTRMANMLHGKVRPGHFRGVTTVVARLFNIVGPDAAVFGEKDYQQLQIIRRMVADLHFPIEIIGVPTQRAPDGLALSSRNVRLSERGRVAALVLSRALGRAEQRAAKADATIEALADTIKAEFAAEPLAALKGLDIVEANTLVEASGPLSAPIAIMLSADVDGVLLIDQRVIAP